MTTRNRIIYQSEALFTSRIRTGDATDTVGNIPSSNIVNLQRVTEVSNNAEVTRQDVNVFGKLASISREIIEEPTVTLDYSYYLADGYNESGFGFKTNGLVNCTSGILSNDPSANRNYYILTVEEGIDANGINPTSLANSGLLGIIGIGNGFISNYTVNGSVGEIPTADISVEASNISFALSHPSGVQNPAIDITASIPTQFAGLISLPTPSSGKSNGDPLSVKVLRPGDIQIDFGTSSLEMGGAILNGMTSASTKQSAHIQSFSLEVPLSRTPQNRLGNAFSFSREVDVPINVTLNVTANLADIDEGSLNDLICADTPERDVTISLYDPCETGPSNLNMRFTLKGATLDSQNMSSNIGDSKTVDLTFSAQIGGPNDIEKGLFISGKHSY